MMLLARAVPKRVLLSGVHNSVVPGMSRRKKVTLGCLGVLVLLFGGAWLIYGDAIRDLWPHLMALTQETKKRQYNPGHEKNLQAIHQALMLYHDSEGQFPEAAGWMDAIRNYIRANDMTEEEAEKKLRRPDLESGYGYAFNDAASEKYKDDLDPKLPLVFESKSTEANAHDAGEQWNGLAITVDGSFLRE